MWISEQIADNNKDKSIPSIGFTVKSGDGKVTVRSGEDYKDIPIIAPKGISYLPVLGDEVAVFPTERGAVCSSVCDINSGVKEGELMLGVPSGGYILLKNNGEVVINGITFAKEVT